MNNWMADNGVGLQEAMKVLKSIERDNQKMKAFEISQKNQMRMNFRLGGHLASKKSYRK
jgi:hypothetical protein